jgi:uncharacterized protein (DUF2384 family)
MDNFQITLDGIDGEIENLSRRLGRLAAVRQAVEENFELFSPIIVHALQVWGEDEDTWNWLCKPLVLLQGRTALEAVAAGDADDVRKILGAIQHGLAA